MCSLISTNDSTVLHGLSSSSFISPNLTPISEHCVRVNSRNSCNSFCAICLCFSQIAFLTDSSFNENSPNRTVFGISSLSVLLRDRCFLISLLISLVSNDCGSSAYFSKNSLVYCSTLSLKRDWYFLNSTKNASIGAKDLVSNVRISLYNLCGRSSTNCTVRIMGISPPLEKSGSITMYSASIG